MENLAGVQGPFPPFSTRRVGMGLLCLLLLTGCDRLPWFGGWAGARESEPIARVDGNPLTEESFQEFLMDVFGSPEDVQGGDDLLSRLLDQYLEEQLFLAQAVRLGIPADEEEVRRSLAVVVPDTGGSEADRERFRGRFRNSLLVHKLKDMVIAERVKVTQEEIEAVYGNKPDQFRVPTVVRLRQILVDEREEAESIRAALEKDVDRFPELAAEHSLAPDGGRPRSYEEDELPEQVREVISVLKDGELTGIVENVQGFQIFQLIGKERAQALPRTQVYQRIKRDLYRERSKKVLDGYLQELRQEIPVEILAENLSFRYVERE